MAHDPTSEEAASSLMRVYSAQGHRQAVSVTYERCRAALEALGLRPSPALEEAHRTIGELSPTSAARSGPPAPSRLGSEERRLVSVLFVELSGPVGNDREVGPGGPAPAGG